MTVMKPRTETVTLWQGDDLAELGRLRAAIEEAADGAPLGPEMLDESDPAVAAGEAYNAFHAEAKDRAVDVVVRAIRKTKWRELMAAHPPRDGKEADGIFGANVETFGDALLLEPATIVNDDLASLSARTEFLDSLSEGDWESLFRAAFAVNRSTGEAPKAFPLSELIQSSDET